jgi:hypothetical protein
VNCPVVSLDVNVSGVSELRKGGAYSAQAISERQEAPLLPGVTRRLDPPAYGCRLSSPATKQLPALLRRQRPEFLDELGLFVDLLDRLLRLAERAAPELAAGYPADARRRLTGAARATATSFRRPERGSCSIRPPTNSTSVNPAW